MIFNSIRWRLQAWHGLILVIVLTGFGFTAYQVARDNQLRRIDQELGQRLAALFRPQPGERMKEGPDHPPGPPPEDRRGERRFDPPEFLAKIRGAIQHSGELDLNQSNTFYYALWNGEGVLLARSPAAPAEVPIPHCSFPREFQTFPGAPSLGRNGPPQPGAPFETRTRGELRELYRTMPHNDVVLVGRSMAPDIAAMRRLALWLFAAGAGILLLGLAGGWWLSTRAIRPIEAISSTATKIAAGDLSQRISVADTESELGRLAGVLNSTFARLEAAFAHQSRFTADASHELRTPISVIVTQTQTALSRERPPTEYREALQACQRAAKRMRSLTESLLQLARLDAGEEPMRRERFDLARVTQECLDLIQPLAAEHGIQIHADLQETTCLGDSGRIAQVVTNLLTNAISFNRELGEVRLSSRSENGFALLSVADTGEGMPPEDLPHIFDRFYRVDKSRSRIQGRTGLGLAICKAIVDNHGGTIEVTSLPGKGSTFLLKLPTA